MYRLRVIPALAAFEDIKMPGPSHSGDPESVPAGQYAQEALTSLGIYDEIAAKASFGTNVTEVLNWVAEGSADAGIVYATDAATTDKVKVVSEAPEGPWQILLSIRLELSQRLRKRMRHRSSWISCRHRRPWLYLKNTVSPQI